jgi:cytochrome b561
MFARTLAAMMAHHEYKGPYAKAHHWVTRLFHWSTAVLLIYGIVRNAEVTGALFDEQLIFHEVAFSTAVGVLFLGQLVWIRFFAGGSRLSPTAPTWERVASRAVHFSIYALVAFMVITGLMIAHTVLGTPGLVGRGRAAINDPFLVSLLTAHIRGSEVLMLLLVIHIAGALWHWVVRKDGVWEAMVGDPPTFRGVQNHSNDNP